MYRSVVDYAFNNVFLTFYILQVGLPNVAELSNLPPTLSLNGPGCINNVLINLFSGIPEISRDRVLVLKTVSPGSLGHRRLAETSLSCGG